MHVIILMHTGINTLFSLSSTSESERGLGARLEKPIILRPYGTLLLTSKISHIMAASLVDNTRTRTHMYTHTHTHTHSLTHSITHSLSRHASQESPFE